MSFGTLKVRMGRNPITVLELDLDFCQNIYGTAPCTAAVGTTGTQKCFNGFKSCQDTDNYNRGTKTYTFCSNNSFLPIGQNLFPCITGVDITPTRLVPEDFSISAACTVTMQDFPHHDRGVDPYVLTRSYDPNTQGSFFGKLRARNPYLQNRVMRLKTGYVDDDRTIYTMSRTYLIDHIEGPDANGQVRIVGKDPLRYTDDYQVPAPSKGILLYDLTVDAIDNIPLVAGAGAAYPSSGVVRLDDELIAYTSKNGDNLVGLTRGLQSTMAELHDAATKVQLCVVYTNETIPNILYDLLVNYAERDTSQITLGDWVTEASNWLGAWTSSVVLSDPASVRDVLKEILKATGSSLWWDEEAAQIRFKILVPFLIKADVVALNETQHILENSMQLDYVEKDRVSRVSTYFMIDSPINEGSKKDFLSLLVQVDTDTESADAYGTPQNLEILSRWTPGLTYASAVGNRMLYRKRETPIQVTIRVDAKDTVKTGELRDITSRLLQDLNGNQASIRFLVTEAHEVIPGTVYEYKLIQVAPKGGKRAALFAPNTTNVWTSATADEKKNYLCISNNNGFMSDGTPGPTLC